MRVHTLVLILAACFALFACAAEQSVLQDAKAKLYTQIDFANKQFYDKSGKLRDDVFDTWSQSQLKAWADAHGLKVPQTSKKDEVTAYYRRHRYLLQQDIDEFLAQASKTANPYISKATNAASNAASHAKDAFFDLWTDSRLKSFLEGQGVQVPASSTKEKLVELAKENKKKLDDAYDSFDFDKWSISSLQKWLEERGEKVGKDKDQLVSQAKKYLSKPLDQWSDADLKSYLNKFGVKTEAKDAREKVLSLAKSNQNLFKYGEFTDSRLKAQSFYYLKVIKYHIVEHLTNARDHLYEHLGNLYDKIFGQSGTKTDL